MIGQVSVLMRWLYRVQVFSLPVLCTFHSNRSHSCGSICNIELCAAYSRNASRNDVCFGLDASGVVFCSFGPSCLRRRNLRATWKCYAGDSLLHLLDFDSYGLVERPCFSFAVCCTLLHLRGSARDYVVFWSKTSYDFATEPVPQIWPRNSTDWVHADLHANVWSPMCKFCSASGRSAAGEEVVVVLWCC